MTDSASTATPSDSPAAPGFERLMYASLCTVKTSVFDEMQRIRAHALKRNVADDVHVALLYQSGWFVEWMEGPSKGVHAVMARVARDTRHRQIRLLHSSHGRRRLSEPWSMAITQTQELPTDFARRVMEMREHHRLGQELDPAAVWRRLSTPLTHPGAREQALNDHFQRVIVVSAQGTDSFDLVRWLGQSQEAEVVHRRFAGARDDMLDVATDYVDVDTGAVVRRVIAMARNGLQIGLTQAFLSDYSHAVLLLSGDAERDHQLMVRMVAACEQQPRRPVLLGVGSPACKHAELRRLAHKGGLVYLDCERGPDDGVSAVWAATEPALDLSLATQSGWPGVGGSGWDRLSGT